MRKVKIKAWIPARYNEGSLVTGTNMRDTEYSTDGVFHQWANGYDEFESGPGNFTYALVELADGTMEQVAPQHLRFVKPFEKLSK